MFFDKCHVLWKLSCSLKAVMFSDSCHLPCCHDSWVVYFVKMSNSKFVIFTHENLFDTTASNTVTRGVYWLFFRVLLRSCGRVLINFLSLQSSEFQNSFKKGSQMSIVYFTLRSNFLFQILCPRDIPILCQIIFLILSQWLPRRNNRKKSPQWRPLASKTFS